MGLNLIKDAVDLRELAMEYGKFSVQGEDLTGKCLFHDERTASLRIHRSFFKCFGCGAGGDCFTFISMIESVSLGRAMALLSQRTGIPLGGSKRRTPIQRAGDRQDLAFALWWHGRQVTNLSRQLTTYCIYATEEECEDFGLVLRQLRGLDRQAIIGAARRLGTAQHWRDWETDKKDAEFWTGVCVEMIICAS